jgi:hypothetical protein
MAKDHLHCELKVHCKAEIMDLKLLLVLDNASGDPPMIETL